MSKLKFKLCLEVNQRGSAFRIAISTALGMSASHTRVLGFESHLYVHFLFLPGGSKGSEEWLQSVSLIWEACTCSFQALG